MKKQLLSLCGALALSIPVAFAGETTLTSAQGLAIRGLHAGHTFAVTLRQSANTAENGVEVTIDERLKPYLKVTLQKGILYLGFDDLPHELQNADKWCRPAIAEVTLSCIDRLTASGLASITPVGTFSGAATAIKTSDASKIGPITIQVTGTDATEATVSGMSRIENLTLKNARAVEASASGSSNLKLDCDAIRSLRIVASGMSSATVAGSAETVTSKASGGSHLNLEKLKAEKVSCETSGMSSITCYSTSSLDVSSSGGSSVRYRSGGVLRTNFSTSGMSYVAKIE
ncbi:DUF2807 domain-containing protein [uncultured Rikenella sp.]|uniref:GIN domain-containing protein n=1 Tax=uncultured Rikenella sp. TaxID=368003 RepID=UPI00260854B4|nr:DUF2807 domain-containing protein [uncultured Rikenella sp.]